MLVSIGCRIIEHSDIQNTGFPLKACGNDKIGRNYIVKNSKFNDIELKLKMTYYNYYVIQILVTRNFRIIQRMSK